MISVIVPTMGKRDLELHRLLKSLEDQVEKDFEVIIVSQMNYEKVDKIIKNFNLNINHVKIKKIGLSHARNVGMKYVRGNIVTFSDDDCWYSKNAFKHVKETFVKSNTDVACFQIFDPEKKEYYKLYPSQKKENISHREIFNKSSIEIFVNLDNVDKQLVKFDEQFGLGAKYPSGEENIFLHDLLKAGYKISYYPKVVVHHSKPDIKTRLNLPIFVSKGPLFKRMYNTPIGIVLLTVLFVKKIRYLDRPIKYYFTALKELIKYRK